LLIVDDEASHMLALCDTLAHEGYRTTGSRNATEALALLNAGERFDLVLTDLRMPDMDGISLLRAAQQLDPHIAGIIMTGEGSIATAVEAMKSGALDYVLKPFKLNAVLPVLARALELRRLRLRNEALERGLRERTAELEEINRDLEIFAASVSHDLRAPLRSIQGLTHMLRGKLPESLNEEARVPLDLIGRSVERMRDLVEGLMRLARVGQQPLRRHYVDIEALVRSVEADLRLQPGMETLSVDIVGPLPPAHADDTLLRQIFVNLLSNAYKFSRHKAPPLIEVGYEEGAEGPAYFVRDNGRGFDMTHAHRLFTPFVRLHRAADVEGTGIGLSIVQRVVQRHGGRIWVRAASNLGASFLFTLPQIQAAAAQPAEACPENEG
jgi:signal transduction histidine kinase